MSNDAVMKYGRVIPVQVTNPEDISDELKDIPVELLSEHGLAGLRERGRRMLLFAKLVREGLPAHRRAMERSVNEAIRKALKETNNDSV